MARAFIPDGEPMSLRTMYRRKRAQGLTRPVQKYFFNEDFFFEWSPELAWLCGVIWSDGCLFSQTIEVCSKDKQLLDTIAAIIAHNVGAVPKNNGKHWRLLFSSQHIADKLRSEGLHEKKSFTIQAPKTLPSKYSADFVRGLFDGDGSTTLRKSRQRPGQRVADCCAYICGASENLKDWLKNWMQDNGIGFNERYKGKCWRLSIVNQTSLAKFYVLLYHSDSVPKLERKHFILRQWFITPRYQAGGKDGVPRLSSAPCSLLERPSV